MLPASFNVGITSPSFCIESISQSCRVASSAYLGWKREQQCWLSCGTKNKLENCANTRVENAVGMMVSPEFRIQSCWILFLVEAACAELRGNSSHHGKLALLGDRRDQRSAGDGPNCCFGLGQGLGSNNCHAQQGCHIQISSATTLRELNRVLWFAKASRRRIGIQNHRQVRPWRQPGQETDVGPSHSVLQG